MIRRVSVDRPGGTAHDFRRNDCEEHVIPVREAAIPVLSVIVPMFNEASNVDALFDRLVPVVESLRQPYEIIGIDDGSRDDTLERLVALRERYPALKIVALSRNFGKEIALTAGLQHATGRAAIPIDADLQHPPEIIPRLVEKWREGFEVVYAVRKSRETDSPLRRLSAGGFYWVFQRLSDVPLPKDAGDYRLLDRKVVDAINAMPERSRFMKGIFAWVGFRQIGVTYDVEPRREGASGWSARKLFHFAVDGLTSFSNFPLIAWGYVGAVIASASLVTGGFFVLRTLMHGVDVPGYASIMVAVLFFGGVQLITLGIIGSYIGRIFQEVKRRPLYLVRETHGFAPAKEEAPQPPVRLSAP
jgi:glycosyltransferase involved in cell wall biosynthesis